MLAITYTPDLEILGAITLVMLVGWCIERVWLDVQRARRRRRRRERRKIEAALVARTRCGDCGSRRLVVEVPEPTDKERALEALGRYIGRARAEASAR